MATETGNTYIAETITDSIEIPTAYLRFMVTVSSKKAAKHSVTTDIRTDRHDRPTDESMMSIADHIACSMIG